MHTKNLPVVTISHCPLSSKFTFSKSTPYTRRCLEIIESARITWGYYSDDYKSCCYEIVDGVEVPKKFPPYSTLKLTSARSIQSWYTEHSDLFLASQKMSEAIKKAVQDARRYARPGIDNDITDKEILAIFAICEAFDVVYKIQRGEPEDAIKENVLSASTFLKLAKAGIEPATQALATPKDIKEIYYDDREGKLFVDKNPVNLTHTEKVFFEYFWDHKSRNITVNEINEHMTSFDEFNNTTWDRRYFDKTLSSINCKGKTLGVKKLIKNVEHGKKEYVISIKVNKKTFKP